MRKILTMEEEEETIVKEIIVPTLKPCIICGTKVPVDKDTDFVVCSIKHQEEWKKREDEKNKKFTEKPTKTQTKKLIKETNGDPEAKKHGIVVIKKSTKIMLFAAVIILLTLLTIQVFWFNSSISDIADKNTTIEVNTPITVNSPDIPITNTYNNPISVNLNISLSEEMAQEIADEVIQIINNTNFTQ